MIFNSTFVFTILFITINANPFEIAFNKVSNQLNQIKNDRKRLRERGGITYFGAKMTFYSLFLNDV